MSSAAADRNLLFGILALQNNFIGRDALLAAFAAWIGDKSRPLSQHLLAERKLKPTQLALLDALVDELLQQHGGSAEQCLESLSSIRSARGELEQLGDQDLQASLRHVSVRWQEVDRGSATIPPTTLGAPSEVGTRFRILRPHAEGGLGKVSVARDEELNREVALKEIKPDYAHDSDSRSRFTREAEITGGLEHPGIVPVYGLGQYADGRPFYAMRFIKGDSLKEAIAAYHSPQPDAPARDAAGSKPPRELAKNPGPSLARRAKSATEKNLELRRLLQRFIDVCEAIEYAHSRGVLHRDLKPGNIMLGKYGETLVVDWGLARAGKSDGSDPSDTRGLDEETSIRPRSGDSSATEMGSALGTPAFMPPEQAQGRLDLLGPASDIYSLGATLYALLTNQAPVQGTTTEQVLAKVCRGNIIPPRQIVPDIPLPLAAICMKALALNRQDRYASARDLAADVERYLADEPVTVYAEPIVARARRWGRKHPGVVSGAVATLSVTLLAVVITTFILTGMNFALAEQTREAKEQEAIATAVKDFLLYDLLELADAAEQANAGIRIDPETKVRTLFQRAETRIAGRFADAPRVETELRKIVATGLNNVDPALTIRTAVLRAADKIEGRFEAQPKVELEIRWSLGNTLLALGEPMLAITQLLRTKDLYVAIAGPEHPNTLHSMNDLANAYSDAGRFDEALRLHEETLDLNKAKSGPEHPDTLVSMNNLASAYRAVGRLEEALPMYEDTLKLMNAKLGSEHPDTLRSMNNLANAYHDAGRREEALPLYEETLKLRKAKLGPEHPDTLRSMANLANAYHDAGRREEALPLFEETLKLRKAKLGPEHPDTLGSMDKLALAYYDAGRREEALPLFEETLKLSKAKLGPEHPDTLRSMNNLATAYSDVGRLDEAVPLYEETLKLRKATFWPEHPDTVRATLGLALAEFKAEKWPQAEAYLLTAYSATAQFPADMQRQFRSPIADQLVELYEAWDKPTEAAKWREELEKLQSPEQ